MRALVPSYFSCCIQGDSWSILARTVCAQVAVATLADMLRGFCCNSIPMCKLGSMGRPHGKEMLQCSEAAFIRILIISMECMIILFGTACMLGRGTR